MPQCLGKLEYCALQFICTFHKRSGKHSIIPLSLVFQGTAVLHTFLFVPKASLSFDCWSLRCPQAVTEVFVVPSESYFF